MCIRDRSGMASSIKMVMALQKQQIPATLHFREPNRYVRFHQGPVYINDSLKDWQSTKDGGRLCGVSSFGFSGTNVHTVSYTPLDVYKRQSQM